MISLDLSSLPGEGLHLLDEDELRGLTCELAGEMGIPKLPAARLVAKVQGLGLRPSETGAGAAAQPIASLPQEA